MSGGHKTRLQIVKKDKKKDVIVAQELNTILENWLICFASLSKWALHFQEIVVLLKVMLAA